MDTNVYSEAVIRRFMKKNMFMDDETLVDITTKTTCRDTGTDSPEFIRRKILKK